MSIQHRAQTFSIETKPAPFVAKQEPFHEAHGSAVDPQQNYIATTAITW